MKPNPGTHRSIHQELSAHFIGLGLVILNPLQVQAREGFFYVYTLR